MLTRFRAQGFKSLRDLEVELAPLVVVLGPNDAGKSNFLEALGLLARLATVRSLDEGFAGALRGDPAESFSLPSSGSPELSLEADLLPPSAGRRQAALLRYRLTVAIRRASATLAVADEYLVRLRKDGRPKHKPRIEREGDHLVARRLGEASRPRHEPLGLAYTLASDPQLSGAKRYPDFDVLRRELSSWRAYELDPRDAMRRSSPPTDASDIGPRGQRLAPLLYRLQESAEHRGPFDAARRWLREASPAIDDLRVEVDPRKGTLDVVLDQHGAPCSARLVSAGTLRWLGLCALAANPWSPRLLLLEEPENGLHPGRVGSLARLLLAMVEGGERQVIVATHSSELVNALARRRERGDKSILLLRFLRQDRATRFEPFDPQAKHGPLFAGPRIQDALSGSDDD